MNISESSLTEPLFIFPEGTTIDYSTGSIIVQVGLAALATYSIARCYLKKFKATLTTEKSFAKKKFFKAVFPGKSDIYLNPDRPDILIKFPTKDSRWEPTKRAQKQYQYKQMCERAGYHHLVVPAVWREKNYLIEENLPITHPTHVGQIAFYYQNKERCTEAIKEFTHLLCTQKLIVLIWGNCHFRAFTDLDPPKYDNIPLYLQNGVVKMGLIDLERFSIELIAGSTSASHFIEACSTAIQFYPYHFDSIVEVAKSYDPDIEYLQESLTEIRDEALLYFEKIYFAHERFLNKHDITVENPFKRVEISNMKRKKIVSTLEKKFCIPLRKKISFFKKKISIPQLRKNLLPALIDQVLQYLQTLIEKKSGKVKELTDVMELRTLKLSVLDYIQDEFLSEIFSDYIREDIRVRTLFTVWTMDQVLEALVEHEVILFFHNELNVIQF